MKVYLSNREVTLLLLLIIFGGFAGHKKTPKPLTRGMKELFSLSSLSYF